MAFFIAYHPHKCKTPFYRINMIIVKIMISIKKNMSQIKIIFKDLYLRKKELCKLVKLTSLIALISIFLFTYLNVFLYFQDFSDNFSF